MKILGRIKTRFWVVLVLLVSQATAPGASPARALQPAGYTVYLPCILVYFSPFVETEPNGSDLLADGPILSGLPYFGANNSALDSDYWRFTASAAGPVHLEVVGLDSFGQVTLTRLGGAQVGYVGGPPYVINGTLPAPGDYVARVVSTAMMGNGVYTLTVTYP